MALNLIPSFLRKKPTQEIAPSAATLNSPGWLSGWGSSSGGLPLFGSAVTETSALSVSAVYRCTTLIAGVIASLDLGIYTDDPDKGQVLVKNKVSKLLQIQPYPGRQTTSFIWKETMAMNLLLWGNHFSVIRYDQAARIVGFEYAPPWIVQVKQLNFRNIYEISWPNGRPVEVVDQDNIIHVPGPGYDGLLGMSRIRQNARNSIALAKSLEETLGKALDNAMSPKTVVKLPQGMTPDATKRLQTFMANEFGGRTNAGKTLFLDAGSDVSSLQINLVDLAIIDALKMSVTDICAYFGCPPVLLGADQTSSWGTGVEQLILGWLRFGLNSDLERIEAEFTAKVCSDGQYVLFDRDQLLAMDSSVQADVLAKEIACGLSTPNESRRRKHRATVPGGDEPLVAANLISLKNALIQKPVPAAPPTTQTPPKEDPPSEAPK